MFDLSFYKGKRVFLTGHTGFKGTWLSRILVNAGAVVTGYSLEPPTRPNLFELADLTGKMTSVIGDVRDYAALLDAFQKAQPEIVLHLAAQPIVLTSYEQPQYTYETNVMGTVNLLECVRVTGGVKSVLNVTTDKVYENNEWCWGYRENEPLDGFDPYSNSKSCSELVTHCYKRSFFDKAGVAVSTARAGNVIGGGDFADNRIIPDCVRAAMAGKPIVLRNPNSIRPYQHVLDPLYAYLMIAAAQYDDMAAAGYYNVGPNESDCLTTGRLAEIFCETWGKGMTFECLKKDGPHEANFLKLDCARLKAAFGWAPRWSAQTAVEKAVEWTAVYADGGDAAAKMDEQINEFFGKEI